MRPELKLEENAGAEFQEPSADSAKARLLGPREGESRRAFLKRSAVTSAVAVPGLILAGASVSQAARKPPVFHLPELYPGWNSRNFHEILADEAAHVAIITELLQDSGNPLTPKVRAMPTLKNLEQPNILAFVQGAIAFENTGTGTYAGALFAIQQTQEYFPLAAGITTVEARHAGYLNTLLNEPIVPNFFPSDTTIPQSVALSHVDPFIANVNGTVPSFDPNNASDPNNFAILDFLLLLEMIETAFYQVNVKKFFG
jgi:Ferritin-like domain